jgi:hypothetical protein
VRNGGDADVVVFVAAYGGCCCLWLDGEKARSESAKFFAEKNFSIPIE